MSDNVSTSRRRAEVMAAALENFRTWEFEVECANCSVRKRLPVADLAQRFGSLPVREVVGRLHVRSRAVVGGRITWCSGAAATRSP